MTSQEASGGASLRASVSNTQTPASSAPRFAGVRTLGKPNADGFVQLAFDRVRQRQVAIKYIPRSQLATSTKHVLREVLNHHQLSLCQYPHIVQLHEVFVTPRYLGVVMEYVDGQDMQTYLMKQGGKVPVDIARFLFQQLVLAVDFMHKRGKVHRDIRLSNVLVVDSGVMPLIKLRNLHLSKDKFDDSVPRGQVGAALFTAPEVVLNVGGHPYDGELVDAWSCGVILFMMLFGHHPFLSRADMALGEAEQVVRLIENEVKGQLSFPENAEPLVCDLLRRLLVPAPKQRYNIQDVMGHAWFQKKLPAGALELNSSYLQVTSYQDVQQSPATIKQLIQAAAQPTEPAAAPAKKPDVSASAPASAENVRSDKDQPLLLRSVMMQALQTGQLTGVPVSLLNFSGAGPAEILGLRMYALSADQLRQRFQQ